MYGDLHDLAHRRLNAVPHRSSMDTTGLVHESYLRLLKAGRLAVTDRHHFMVYSAHVMRSVIVDLMRKNRAERRGGDAFHVTLNTNLADQIPANDGQILRLNDALNELGYSEPRLVQVVEMRYFVGLSEVETAEALGVAVRTVRRDWQKARLLLLAVLQASES